jgi:hypothetical protein
MTLQRSKETYYSKETYQVTKTLKRGQLSVKRDRTEHLLLDEAVRVTPTPLEVTPTPFEEAVRDMPESVLDHEDVRLTPTGSFSSAGAVEA